MRLEGRRVVEPAPSSRLATAAMSSVISSFSRVGAQAGDLAASRRARPRRANRPAHRRRRRRPPAARLGHEGLRSCRPSRRRRCRCPSSRCRSAPPASPSMTSRPPWAEAPADWRQSPSRAPCPTSCSRPRPQPRGLDHDGRLLVHAGAVIADMPGDLDRRSAHRVRPQRMLTGGILTICQLALVRIGGSACSRGSDRGGWSRQDRPSVISCAPTHRHA
jgi:hypothetical protein